MKCRWIHIIDSKERSGTAPDEGTFTKLPNGDDLERGKMACPERGGAITEYEEVWRVLDPLPGPKWAWILQSVDGKTFVGRIGGGYIALREGNQKKFGARSEEWDAEEGGWRVKHVIGEQELLAEIPSFARFGKYMFEGESGWAVGGHVDISGKGYIVRGFENT